MAGKATVPAGQPPGNGKQVDERKIRFGRTPNKQRVGIKFAIPAAAQDDAPKYQIYDRTGQKWEIKPRTEIVCNVLVSTKIGLNLQNSDLSTKKGTKSGAKVWKVVVLADLGKAETTAGESKDGIPKRYTTYNIPVPGWVSSFLFAKCIYTRLKAVVSHAGLAADAAAPTVLDVVGYISPHGISYSNLRMEALAAGNEPPEREDPSEPDENKQSDGD